MSVPITNVVEPQVEVMIPSSHQASLQWHTSQLRVVIHKAREHGKCGARADIWKRVKTPVTYSCHMALMWMAK